MRGGPAGPATPGWPERRVGSLLPRGKRPAIRASTRSPTGRDRLLDEAERAPSVPRRLQAEPVRPARDPEGATQPDRVP
jgi:hypothetical protein